MTSLESSGIELSSMRSALGYVGPAGPVGEGEGVTGAASGMW